MEFLKFGRSFKSKSGQSTIVSISEQDIDLLYNNMRESIGQDGKNYGRKVSLIITGDADSNYGHSVSIIKAEN